MSKFVNRKDELNFLEDTYKKGKTEFIVIYGRRRVGKTELVNQFIKNKPHIYFLADERGDYFNLKDLQKSMGEFLEEELFKKADIIDWDELFTEFTKRVKTKIIIVIDEFPYLVSSNKAIPSIFQKIWDLNLSKKDVYLILLGSSVSMMENYVLSYKAPLYGRRTGQLNIKPLRFKYIPKFFPKYNFEDIIKVYSVTDGIPLYILKFNPGIGFFENLKENVLKVGAFLYEETEILMKQELRETTNYFNILKAIAFGKTKYGEIVNFSRLDKTIVSKYLDNLISLRIIKKEYPITQKKEMRNAIYKFEDNYFNFWFRFIYPNKSLIEQNRQGELTSLIKEDFNLYLSSIFEKLCRELQWDIRTGFTPTKVGRWWHKDKEIDIAGLNEKTKEILFAECKWQDETNAEKILEELKEKSEFVDWNKDKRKEYYAVFAKSFKKRVKNCYCFDLKDISKHLQA